MLILTIGIRTLAYSSYHACKPLQQSIDQQSIGKISLVVASPLPCDEISSCLEKEGRGLLDNVQETFSSLWDDFNEEYSPPPITNFRSFFIACNSSTYYLVNKIPDLPPFPLILSETILQLDWGLVPYLAGGVVVVSLIVDIPLMVVLFLCFSEKNSFWISTFSTFISYLKTTRETTSIFQKYSTNFHLKDSAIVLLRLTLSYWFYLSTSVDGKAVIHNIENEELNGVESAPTNKGLLLGVFTNEILFAVTGILAILIGVLQVVELNQPDAAVRNGGRRLSLRRLSQQAIQFGEDVGNFTIDTVTNEIGGNASVSPEDDLEAGPVQADIAPLGHILFQWNVNVASLLQSIPGALLILLCFVILGYTRVNYPAYIYPIGFLMWAYCAEICILLMTFSLKYTRKKIIILSIVTIVYGIPVLAIPVPLGLEVSAILMSFCYGTSLAIIAQLFPSNIITSFPSKLKTYLKLAIVLLPVPALFIWIAVVGSLYMQSQGEEWNMVYTGLIIPFITFLYRKFTSPRLFKKAESKVADGSIPKDKLWSYYANMAKAIATIARFPGIVLMYTNTNIKYAILACLMSGLIEVCGRYASDFAIKKELKLFRLKLQNPDITNIEIATMLSSVEVVVLSAEQRVLYVAKKKAMLHMIAVNWQPDMVAEKSCILLGGLVNIFVFGSGNLLAIENLSSLFLTGIFFGFEFVVDFLTVGMLGIVSDVPIRELERSDMKESIMQAITMSFILVTVAAGIWMANLSRGGMAGVDGGIMANTTAIP